MSQRPAPVPSPAPASAHGELSCTYTYGGETKRLTIAPTRDPYRVAPIDVDSRFGLKVVYVDEPADVAGVRVYIYYAGTDAPVLLHEGKYELLRSVHGPYGFTGKQLMYDPGGRELEYFCEWSER